MAAKVFVFPQLSSTETPAAEVVRQDSSERILAAAYKLYNDPGRAGIAELAAAAGVSVTEVESLFGDEQGVRRAVLNELLAFALAGHSSFGHPKL